MKILATIVLCLTSIQLYAQRQEYYDAYGVSFRYNSNFYENFRSSAPSGKILELQLGNENSDSFVIAHVSVDKGYSFSQYSKRQFFKSSLEDLELEFDEVRMDTLSGVTPQLTKFMGYRARVNQGSLVVVHYVLYVEEGGTFVNIEYAGTPDRHIEFGWLDSMADWVEIEKLPKPSSEPTYSIPNTEVPTLENGTISETGITMLFPASKWDINRLDLSEVNANFLHCEASNKGSIGYMLNG